MEEEEDMSSPFWLQSRQSHRHHFRRRSSSFLFNSGVLLIFLLAVAVAFTFIIIPTFQSFTSQIFKPQLVKKSWDSLNLILVLFAIICGFLSRNTGNNESTAATTTTTSSSAGAATTATYYEDYKFENRSESFPKSNPETPRRFWYDHPHPHYNNNNNNNNGGLSRLRSFSSHPDLRQEEALWVNRDDQWRFYDDTHLYNNRFSSFNYQQQQQFQVLQSQPRLQPEPKLDEVKNVDANTTSPVEESQKEVIYTPPTAPPPVEEQLSHPTSLPLQTKTMRRRVKKTYHESSGNDRNNDFEFIPPAPPSPTSRRRPPHPEPVVEESGGKCEKKRGGTSATKEFLTSLRRKKKNKQRQKSVEDLDSFFNYESSYPLPNSFISPAPPPPPPPPLPPFFHSIFSSKKRKAKKIHSVIPSPPPPPPPPRPRTQKLSTSGTRNAPLTSQNPPLQERIKSYSNVEENVNSGNQSPMNAIPPPPPLPPFKMSAWKFEVKGDYVRLKSNIADEVEDSSSPSAGSEAAMYGGDSQVATPLFCPSPDVDTKADNFIARFRAGLRLEKMNSVRVRSNLGPEPSPSQEGESPT